MKKVAKIEMFGIFGAIIVVILLVLTFTSKSTSSTTHTAGGGTSSTSTGGIGDLLKGLFQKKKLKSGYCTDKKHKGKMILCSIPVSEQKESDWLPAVYQ